MANSTRTPILKLIWLPMPKVAPGHAFIHRLFDIQIGTQDLVEQHWDHIRERLRERYDSAAESEFESIQMKPGDRLTYYDDGSIKVYQ